MSKVETLAVPGLAEARRAYAELRELGASPLLAQDMLTEHARTLADEDLCAQLRRNHGQSRPIENADTLTADMIREIARIFQVAVAVYNRRRSRITAVDRIATPHGAAAINRAAMIRQTRTTDATLAVLGRLHIDTVTIGAGAKRRYYVCGLLAVGRSSRAVSARFTCAHAGHGITLDQWDVLQP